MKAKILIKSLNSRHTQQLDFEDFQVKGVSSDSRQVLNDFIFVAVKGSNLNGNRFIDQAIKRGAKAVVVQQSAFSSPMPAGRQELSAKAPLIKVKDTRLALAKLASEFYSNPSLKLKVVGITGTNGKTTVCYLIESILKRKGLHPAVIGTINYRFRDRVLPAKNTTPGPIELQSLLQSMLKAKIDYVLMEASSHALDQKRVGGIDFHSAIFTNLTHDHLDYHKSFAKYFQAKARLFKGLKSGSFAVVNNDDRYANKIRRLTKADLVTYGIRKKAEVVAKHIKLQGFHTSFSVVIGNEKIDLKTNLIGRHNLYNILASIAWAQREGIDSSSIKSGLEDSIYIPGRMENIDFEGDFSVYVDYAHTEDALRTSLQALRQICRKRLIVVFGCGGERDKRKRPRMGQVASELSDLLIITNDNPRSENPQQIISDIKKGIKQAEFSVIPQRLEAIKKSLLLARAGDVVLIAGKGHEDYQIINDQRIHFDDREVARECLKSLNY
ncbi:MAG: UDP-N-acetylmuramoyl-L-alanyl-D-glutamate--2,6-diaminopimelate ligase [Candidatus Omnitrophica bacterium]|nr:UDP-N-acetylmuramoyl-L-alanyl-D-glutamate--2,6-diaminopimelate ligase [Candidatus Omnitrophota bacterium]